MEPESLRRKKSESLCREELYLGAVQSFVREPLRSEADYRQFLLVLRACLDHVLEDTSPTLLPRLLEAVYPSYSRDETVLLMLAKSCLHEEMYTEAEFLWKTVLTGVNADCLLAREGLCNLYEVLVPRWHFPMLNDVTRNASYARAITNVVARIPDCTVLDIGSGTGLLSMLAVRAGAARVYACEMNAAMAMMSRDIITANDMTDKITVIHKRSTDLTVPQHLPERVCLVVTETVDTGLLGEATVPTLRDAWSRLLLPRQPPGSANQIARCGHVIPCGATVYVTAIECPEITRQSRLLSEEVGGLSFCGITLEGSHCSGSSTELGLDSATVSGEESGSRGEGLRGRGRRGGRGAIGRDPYACVQLKCTSGGHRELSDGCIAFSLDFTNPQILLPSATLRVSVSTPGYLDAMAMYFDLHLDATISISTSPRNHDYSSWDQAIYPVATDGGGGGRQWVDDGDILHVHVTCSDALLCVSVEKIERHAGDRGMRTVECPVSGSFVHLVDKRTTYEPNEAESLGVGCPVSRSSVHFVDRGALYRLNDAQYFEVYSSAISYALEILQAEETDSNMSELDSNVASINLDGNGMESGQPSDEVMSMESGNGTEGEEKELASCIALDLSHEIPIAGLMAANLGVDFVQVGRCQAAYQTLLEAVVKGNNLQRQTSIKWVELETTSAPQLEWDMVLCDVVSPQGVLQTGVFEELGLVRELQTHSNTVILPGEVRVHAVALSSPELRAQSTVLGSVPTLGLDIARFINKYQITHFIDVDTNTMVHDRLTDDTVLLSVNLSNQLSTKPFTVEEKVRMRVIRAGSLTGFMYWFTLHFPNGRSITTWPDELHHSHWHQAVFIVSEEVQLRLGQYLTTRAMISHSLLDITLVTIE